MSFPALAYRAHINTAATRRVSFLCCSGACVPGSHQSRRYAAPVSFLCCSRRLRTGLTSTPPLRGSFLGGPTRCSQRLAAQMKASTRRGKWKCPPDELSGQKKAAQPDQATKNGATRRVVWPEESSPTRSSHKKRCHQTSCLARRKQPNQIKPQKTVPPDELSGQKEATQPEQAIKNGVTNKPSTLAAVADPKDSKIKP